MPLIRQSKGYLALVNTSVINVTQNKYAMNQPIFKLRDMKILLDHFNASEFQSTLIHSINNIIDMRYSSISNGTNARLKGLGIYLEESSLNLTVTSFNNLTS